MICSKLKYQYSIAQVTYMRSYFKKVIIKKEMQKIGVVTQSMDAFHFSRMDMHTETTGKRKSSRGTRCQHDFFLHLISLQTLTIVYTKQRARLSHRNWGGGWEGVH